MLCCMYLLLVWPVDSFCTSNPFCTLFLFFSPTKDNDIPIGLTFMTPSDVNTIKDVFQGKIYTLLPASRRTMQSTHKLRRLAKYVLELSKCSHGRYRNALPVLLELAYGQHVKLELPNMFEHYMSDLERWVGYFCQPLQSNSSDTGSSSVRVHSHVHGYFVERHGNH